MDKNVKFEYHDGIAICEIKYKNETFVGKAVCHADDYDFESERTGLYIAESRAVIQGLCFERDYEIKPALKILYHLYSNMRTSQYYNPKSYEAKMIRNQIKALEKELAEIKADIAAERASLNDYLTQKEKLYQKLRIRAKEVKKD